MKRNPPAEKVSWKIVQDELADQNGLAIVLVEGEESTIVSKSNNNSICESLYASAEFAHCCARYCGKAFQNATAAGKTIEVKCHADLNFLAVPFEARGKKLVAIVGRAFLKAEDYRRATERAMSGDWQDFPAAELFSNVLISSSGRELEKLAGRFEKLSEAEQNALLNFEITAAKLPEEVESNLEKIARENDQLPNEPETSADKIPPAELPKVVLAELTEKDAEEVRELTAWRSLLGSLLKLNYAEAGESILKFISHRFQFANLAWLEQRENALEISLAFGTLKHQQLQIGIAANDPRLLEAIQNETSLEFRERRNEPNKPLQTIHLFPIAIDGQVREAVIVGEVISDEKIKKRIARFARSVEPEIEILRLREEVKQQAWLSRAVRGFNENLKNIDAENFWEFLTRAFAEMLQAERGSLLAFDDESQTFVVKAAVGNHADLIKQESTTLGDRIAGKVLQRGTPLLIENIQQTRIPPAPAGRNYKTGSFISYPITIAGKRIGVLNITDKIDGTAYDETDLQILNIITPQLAVALDRTTLQRKAGEFEQLSITDSLTGLLNRRYLKARLGEEIKRWERDGSLVSFMMIDVDEFKSYNDTYTHPEGDKALQLVAQAMKTALRAVDVAARYGGEEFSILLPQTNLSEAYIIAERVREKVEKTNFPNRPVTVSIGVVTSSPNLDTASKLIGAADKALYQAKRKGRNNVQIYDNLNGKKSPQNIG